ncbi:MAG: rRNA maturation RNase YbeY [Phycisphaerales bacterium JB038]
MDTSILATADDCEADQRESASPRSEMDSSMCHDERDEGDDPVDADADEPESPSGISVELTLLQSAEQAGADLRLDWLEEKAGEALAVLNCECGELSVVLVDDAAMQRAHHDHLGLESTTDVLTFDMAGDSSEGDVLDAEILICIDEAARRAGELGHSTELELLLYIVHGVLHCLGYDDHTEADYQRMHAREDEVLQALNLPPTFEPLRDESEETPKP